MTILYTQIFVFSGAFVEILVALLAGAFVACMTRITGVRRGKVVDAVVFSTVCVYVVVLARALFWAVSGASTLTKLLPVLGQSDVVRTVGYFEQVLPVLYSVWARAGNSVSVLPPSRLKRFVFLPASIAVSGVRRWLSPSLNVRDSLSSRLVVFSLKFVWLFVFRPVFSILFGVVGYWLTMAVDVIKLRMVVLWVITRVFAGGGDIRCGIVKTVVDQRTSNASVVSCSEACEGCQYRSWALEVTGVSFDVGSECDLCEVFCPSDGDEERRRVKHVFALEGDALVRMWIVFDETSRIGVVPGDVSARLQIQSTNEAMKSVLKRYAFYEDVCVARPNGVISAKSAGTLFEALVAVAWKACRNENERDDLCVRVLSLLVVKC